MAIIAGVSFGDVGFPHFVIWTDDTITDLGRLPSGSIGGGVEGLNNRGQIVGATRTPPSNTAPAGFQAVLWDRGTVTAPATLPGGSVSAALEMNNAGTIVGWSSGASFGQHAPAWIKVRQKTTP